MILSTDQLSREIRLNALPERIVSLVPSQTELLADLGLDQEVIGITKFCIHPESWFRSKMRIGGTKNIDLDKIRSLQPDLIIANKEENDRLQIEQLAVDFPVWISDIRNVNDALNMIEAIGKLTNRSREAESMAKSIRTDFDQLSIPPLQKTCLYLIWNGPYMAAGKDTFIHSILQLLGLNSIPPLPRYPEISSEMITSLKPDYIFLSSEPFPFAQKHIGELQQLSPSSKIMLVDGEMFSWYGSRMLKIPQYLKELYADMKRAL